MMNAEKKSNLKRAALVLSGVLIGALNGLLGGGGGMVTVPALHYLGGLPTKKAHATAIGVMLPLCVLSAVTYTLSGVHRWALGGVSALTVTVGGAMGALLLARLKNGVVALLFYALMTLAGVLGIVKWFG